MNTIIYTDGACKYNPGPGGWGCIVNGKELSGGFRHTTNNRMELMAVIKGLSETSPGESVSVFSDSQYVCKPYNENWITGWRKRKFSKVANSDLWVELDALVSEREVTFIWVKGHASNPYNNRCDRLASAAAEADPYECDSVYEKEQGESPSFTSMEEAESPRKEKSDGIISILSSAFGTSITGLFLDTIAKNGYELKKKD